jgi:ATP-dependent helicase IRC3
VLLVLLRCSDAFSDETLESLEQRAEAVIHEPSDDQFDTKDPISQPKSVTYIDFENPFSFVAESSGISRHFTQLSLYAWVGCGGDVYVLECLGRGYIRIQPVETDDGASLFVTLMEFVV